MQIMIRHNADGTLTGICMITKGSEPVEMPLDRLSVETRAFLQAENLATEKATRDALVLERMPPKERKALAERPQTETERLTAENTRLRDELSRHEAAAVSMAVPQSSEQTES